MGLQSQKSCVASYQVYVNPLGAAVPEIVVLESIVTEDPVPVRRYGRGCSPPQPTAFRRWEVCRHRYGVAGVSFRMLGLG